MKPITGNPLEKGNVERTRKCRDEIHEFMDANCKFAELWSDAALRHESMAAFYKGILLKDGVRNVKIHYSKFHGIIAERTDIE